MYIFYVRQSKLSGDLMKRKLTEKNHDPMKQTLARLRKPQIHQSFLWRYADIKIPRLHLNLKTT